MSAINLKSQIKALEVLEKSEMAHKVLTVAVLVSLGVAIALACLSLWNYVSPLASFYCVSSTISLFFVMKLVDLCRACYAKGHQLHLEKDYYSVMQPLPPKKEVKN